MYVACLEFFTQRGNIIASKPKHTNPPYNLSVSLEEGGAQKLWLYKDQLFRMENGNGKWKSGVSTVAVT